MQKLLNFFRFQHKQRSTRKRLITLLISLLFCFLGFIIFYPALFNFFCADDFIWIRTTNDIFTKHDFTSSDHFALSRGRPVQNLVFFLLYQLFQLKPFGYHLLSLILHVFNVLLLFRLLSFLTDKTILRFTGSLIFLVHFVHEETLFWISSLANLLCCSFYLAGLFLFLNWRLNRKKWVLYLLSLMFFILALFSREDAITFPLLIFLIVLFDFPPVQKLNKLMALKISSPFFLSIVFYFLFRTLTLPLSVIGYRIRIDPLIPFKNIGYFLVNLVFPYRFLFDFVGYHKLELLQIYYQAFDLRWLAIPFLLVLFFFLFKILSDYVKERAVLFKVGLTFLLLSILPYLFLHGNGQRFLYFPLLGFSVLSTHFIFSISNRLALKKQSQVRKFIYLFMIVFFLLNFAIIRERSHWWREAGLTARSVVQQIQPLLPAAQESELYFVNLPSRIHGAYIFLTGFEEAVSVLYPEIEGKIKYLGRLNPDEIKKLSIKNLYTIKDGKIDKL